MIIPCPEDITTNREMEKKKKIESDPDESCYRRIYLDLTYGRVWTRGIMILQMMIQNAIFFSFDDFPEYISPNEIWQ